MGNLLGAPVTDKDTHEGDTGEAGVSWAVSTMQGWRVHMEDAHIAEAHLYAAEEQQPATGTANNSGGGKKTYVNIPLPGHGMFAVFDGHGGTFAAMYAGRNLCRVLSRQAKFVQYAKFITVERPAKEATLANDPAALQNYVRSGVELLEAALIDSFVEIDREIALALKGTKVPDADMPYHDSSGAGGAAANPSAGDAAMNTSHSGDPNDATTMQGVGGGENSHSGMNSPTDSALQLLEEEGDSGTTSVVVVLTPDFVVCANAGDSRAVISRLGNKAVPLSFDHKPDDEEEENRIRAAGGYVAGGRVEGDLAVSRGLGDFRFKNMDVVMAATAAYGTDGATSNNDSSAEQQPSPESDQQQQQQQQQHPHHHHQQQQQQRMVMMKPGDQKVSPIPDLVVQGRNAQQDEFIMVACDGIWDVQTNYEAVQTVAEMFKEGETNLGLICEEACDICLSMGSKDNMTVLIVKLPAQKVGDGGGVQARRQLRNAAISGEDDRGGGDDEALAADQNPGGGGAGGGS